jgi:putative transposase
VKFAWIEAEKAVLPIAAMCRVLSVTRAGLYAWRSRPESPRAQKERQLRVLVREAHEKSRKTYGSPRVHAELQANGFRVSKKRVARLMRLDGIKARARRRFKCTTMSEHDQPVAANILDRRFEAEMPNQRWVGDVTELIAGGGKLYLASILDLYSRMLVGWAMSAVNDRHLAMKALEMAIKRRCPSAGLLHHTDQGSPYASEDYQRVLATHGITCSMSRRGNAHDNAAMESWHSTLKAERVSASRAAPRPNRSSSTTSRFSTTSSGGTRRSATSAQRSSKGPQGWALRHNQSVYRIGSSPGPQ